MNAATEIHGPCLPSHPTPRCEHAERCRRAGLALIDGLAHGWDVADLAGWLGGPYARAALARPATRASFGVQVAPARRTSTVLRETHWKLLAGLEQARRGSPAWVVEAKLSGRVRRDDVLGWVPVNLETAPLAERALALFAVDYLLRPADYHGRALVCPRCETVSFGAAGCQHRANDSRASGAFVSPKEAPTVRIRKVRLP